MSEVATIAGHWLGTPYVHGACLRGIGVDCVHLVAEVLREAGLLSAVDCGTYPRDWFLHASDDKLLSAVSKWCDPAPEGDLRPGDILLFQFGRCRAHAGVYLGEGRMVHATRDDGVTITHPEASPYWSKRFCEAWRPRGAR